MGVKHLFIGIAIIHILGCHICKKVVPSGFTVKEFMTYYYNDSVGLYYVFPSDYVPNDGLGVYKKENKGTRPECKLHKNFICSFKTSSFPRLEHYVYEITAVQSSKLKEENFVLKEQSDSLEIWSKEDKVHLSVEYLVSNPGQPSFFYFVGHTDTSLSFRNLRNELSSIVKSVKFDKKDFDRRPQNPFDVAQNAMTKKYPVNYILSLNELAQQRNNYEHIQKSEFIQTFCTYHSFFENSDELDSLKNIWRNQSYLRNVKGGKVMYSNWDAVDYILNESRHTNILMFNENHFNPNHRRLLESLLDSLYENGYRVLAIEALFENDDSLNSRGYPIDSSGFYTKEPQFGRLIREALKTGLKVVGYDDYSANREINQASNIIAKTNLSSDNKVVVLAGFGHIHEKKGSRQMMAAHFKSLSKIDPLTINQVELDLPSDNWLEIMKLDTAQSKSMQCDIFINNQMKDNKLLGYSKTHYVLSDTILARLKTSRKEYIGQIQVFYENEYNKHPEKAIPVLNILIDFNKDSYDLMLDGNSSYIVLVKNDFGKVIYSNSVFIK